MFLKKRGGMKLVWRSGRGVFPAEDERDREGLKD